MNVRSRALCVALCLAAVAGLAACRAGSSRKEEFSSEATVARGAIADVVESVGQVAARNERTLSFGTVRGRVVEVPVKPGQQVPRGQPLVRIDTAEAERQLREAEADLEVAEAVLAEVQQSVASAELARAEASLGAAEAEQLSAQISLSVAQQAGLTPLEDAVADARAARRVAQDHLSQQELSGGASAIRALEYDQAFHQRVLRDAPAGQDVSATREELARVERDLASARAAREDGLRAAQDAVDKAQEGLDSAQAALVRARSGEEDPLAAARLAQRQATGNVDKARKALDTLKAGGESETVQNARILRDASQAEVESAQAAIAASTLTSPFEGVVFDLFVQVDEWVEPTDDVAHVADPRELLVKASVTEMDIARLQVGQSVRVTLDAKPGQVFSGTLTTLPPRGTSEDGVSLYAIEATFETPGSDVRSGSLANLRVVVGEKADVLLIPAAAVRSREQGKPYVVVKAPDGKTNEVSIQVGINDGILVEVLSGLEEGQTVLVPIVAPTSPGGFGPFGLRTAPPVAVNAYESDERMWKARSEFTGEVTSHSAPRGKRETRTRGAEYADECESHVRAGRTANRRMAGRQDIRLSALYPLTVSVDIGPGTREG